MKKFELLLLIFTISFAAACGPTETTDNRPPDPNAGRGAKNTAPTPGPTAEPPKIAQTERPQKIVEMMAQRGEQDSAEPVIKIKEPKANTVLNSSTVKVSLELAGDLKGYMPGMNEETHTGNHIHVILDNQPYEAYYDLNRPFELRNLTDGDHTLRVFPSRPWHESFKNAGAFQYVKFTVRNGGANASEPTTAGGQTMANAAGTPEGKDMRPSNSDKVDFSKPLLTYSRPKGEYKGADTDAIMIDFWLSNAKLIGDGGTYQVRYSVDDGEPHFIEKWEPVWTTGWPAGKHNIKIDLVDKSGNPVENGGYNSTTREITITK